MKILIARRKNPDQNPKISVNVQVREHYTKAPRLSGVKKNSFVSFTSIDKLGINPGSKYDTPLGIYCYPSIYVLSKIGLEGSMLGLPFAGDSPYANLFSARGRILDLEDIDNKDFAELTKEIEKALIKIKGGIDWNSQVKAWRSDSSLKAKFPHILGGRFWYMTLKAAKELGKTFRKPVPLMWNKIFRTMGIGGCLDTGSGIIHTSEPTQAVFFSTKDLYDIKRVNNKYSPIRVDRKKRMGDTIKKEKYKFSLMNEEERIEAVKDRPSQIAYIKHPSKEVQIAAIDSASKHKDILKLIKNPSEEIQLLAVSRHGLSLEHVKNQTDEIKWAALKSHALALEFVKNPTREMELMAIKKMGVAIRYVKDPTEEMKHIAVENAPASIKYIEDPSEEIQLMAIKKEPYYLSKIKNPTPKVIDLVEKLDSDKGKT